MLTKLWLQNYRAHRETRLALDRLTVLVGPNGSGKSSVFRALRLLEAFSRGPVSGWEPDVGPWSESRPQLELGVDGRSAATDWSVELALGGPSSGLQWEVEGTRQAKGTHGDVPTEILDALRTRLVGPLTAEEIAAPRGMPSERFEQGTSGAMTVAVLVLLKLSDDERFERIEADLRALIPGFKRLRIQPVGSRGEQQLLYEFANGTRILAPNASTGTLFATAILTAIHGPGQPRILLLDDLETGLHPSAQMALMEVLRKALEENPDIQFLLSTQSPYVVDAVEPSQVRVFALDAKGAVVVRSLAEHPEARHLAGRLTTGQLWSLDDESKWVLEAT